MPDVWSWRVCVLIAALAVTLDVLLVQYPLVWLGAAALIAVLAQFRSPLSGLAVVIFSCGLANYSPFDAGALSRVYPGDVAIGIFILAWLFGNLPGSPRNFIPATVVNRPLLGIAVMTPISMLWSRLYPDHEVTYAYPHSDVSWTTAQLTQLLLLAATLCIPFAVASGIKRRKDIETVVMLIGAVVAVGTLLTIGGLIFGYGGNYTILGATRAYWGEPWDSSVEVTGACLPFLFAAVLFGRRSVSHYRLMCGLFAFCLIGLVLTFSRESWLLGFFGLLLVSAAWLRSRVNPGLGLLIVVVVSIVIVLSGAVGLAASFYNPDEVYGLERIYYYATALTLFATHPVLGVGAGNYQFFDRTYAEVSAGGVAHNQFLSVAAETGVPGVFMFLWLLFALIKFARRFSSSSVGSPTPMPEWLKTAAWAFVPLWIAECFFREAFLVTAAAGGGTKAITSTIFPWILLGILFGAFTLSRRAIQLSATEKT